MKRPPWLLVPAGLIREGAVVVIDPAEAQHATRSLRLQSGDDVVIADGEGRTAVARLKISGRTTVEAEVVSLKIERRPAGDGITVALAVIDPKAMDWAVQKAVEVGIRTLQPVVTDRTQGGFLKTDRGPHWQRVADQALKQCRRPWSMRIPEARPLDEFAVGHTSAGLVADPDGQPLGALRLERDVVLAVGPEGGFSPGEQAMFRDLQWRRLRLGANVLRSETAAIVGGARLVAQNDEAEAEQGRISG